MAPVTTTSMAAVDLDKENHAPGTTGKLDNAPMRAHGALRVLRTAEKLRVEDSIQSKVSPLQAASTPRHTRGTWESDLALYLQASSSNSPESNSARARLAAQVRASPESPEAWLAFLQHEQGANNGTASRGEVTLFRLYEWATKTIPRSGNSKSEPYLRVWLGYACAQGKFDQDDARDTFKFLKSQRIGDKFACLYVTWAKFEEAAGHPDKAASVLAKGLQCGAEPKADLQKDFGHEAPDGSNNKSSLVTASAPSAVNLAARDLHSSPIEDDDATQALPRPVRRVSNASTTSLTPSDMTVSSNTASTSSGGSQLRALSVSTPSTGGHTSRLMTPNARLMTPAREDPANTSVDEAQAKERRPGSNLTSRDLPMCEALKTPGATPANGRTRTCTANAQPTPATAPRPLNSRPPAPPTPATITKEGQDGGDDSDANTTGELSALLRKNQPKLKRFGLGLKGGGARRLLPGAPAATRVQTGAGNELAAAKATADLHSPNEENGVGAKRKDQPQPMDTDALPKRQALEDIEDDAPTVPLDHLILPQSKGLAACNGATGAVGHMEEAGEGDETQPLPSAAVTRHPAGAPPTYRPLAASACTQRSITQAATPGAAPPPPPPAAAIPVTAVVKPITDAKDHAEFHTAHYDLDADGDAPTCPLPLMRSRAALKPSQPKLRSPEREDEDEDADAPTCPLPLPAVLGVAPHLPMQVTKGLPNHKLGHNAEVAKRTMPGQPLVSRSELPGPMGSPSGVDGAELARKAKAAAAMAAVAAITERPTMPEPLVSEELRARKNKPERRVREDDTTLYIRGVKYTKLECVGKGGSSKVFKVMAQNNKIYAVKRIRITGCEKDTVSGFEDEIRLLTRLKGRDNIVQLIDFEVIRSDGVIYMVLEFGEIDLSHLLTKQNERQQNGQVDENFIRHYWQQMLEAVHTIHEERIVHSDLKPANFLFCSGVLKLIDFGIAKAIQNDTTNIVRDSQVGTVNYMSPEAILNGQMGANGRAIKIGRPSDIWSLGCILYQMVYGHTPFHHIKGLVQKLHAITDPRNPIQFPPTSFQNKFLLQTMRNCLERDPHRRVTIPQLLSDRFLRPSSQPEPVPAPAGGLQLTQEALQNLLAQLPATSTMLDSDVQRMSQEVFKQLSSGKQVDLSLFFNQPPTANPARSVAPPPPAPPPPPPGTLLQAPLAPSQSAPQAHQRSTALDNNPPCSSAAAAAAAIANARNPASRAAAVAELENRKPSNSGFAAAEFQAALVKQASVLNHVEVQERRLHEHRSAAPENSLQSALMQGLARFHIEEDPLDENCTDTFHWNNN